VAPDGRAAAFIAGLDGTGAGRGLASRARKRSSASSAWRR